MITPSYKDTSLHFILERNTPRTKSGCTARIVKGKAFQYQIRKKKGASRLTAVELHGQAVLGAQSDGEERSDDSVWLEREAIALRNGGHCN